ncbi:hypothetical protein MBEHAL_1104 [Halarchaeum acidiphilum MH1-52-1]|uniref:DUF58 domain-containing protein n=1 Tax=Halarchaeum acidiphilum MH1-52-1 TaxID=1261545 RepID=U3A3Z8_9EURY|nr:DUF58 domain-containing protein [Halarchaeum acidiphilum]GAD52344.1 hypothetical protein MBEHAL_1104 [Halarchaeum acidiphilum MH1-52-1]
MIDPAFLDELARFRASLRRETSAQRQGEQRSPYAGEGLTFADYRRYAPGDDTRLIDWRLFARTEELFVKVFEAERNLTVHVLVDASGSMDYGEGDAYKFDYGAKLGLGFAYLAAEEHNDFRFSLFRERPERLDTGRSNRSELLRLVDRLNATDPSGETAFVDALDAYAATIGSKSLVIVVSDLLVDPDDVASGVAALSRNDVVLPQVLSPAELDPEPTGDTIFRDAETGATERAYFGGRRTRTYRERLDDHVAAVTERARDLRADHALIDTGEDFFDAFAALRADPDAAARR